MSLQALIAKLLLKLPASIKIKMAGGEPVVIGGRTLDGHAEKHVASNATPMHKHIHVEHF